MIRVRPLWAAAALLLLVLAGSLLFAFRPADSPPAPPPRPAAAKPELMLLSALPIVFPERLKLDAPDSPALTALATRYKVKPISLTDAQSLGASKLLLMAQPQAQPAEALVELDAWVRGGGRVLLLADPALEWPSELPLGDKLRPPFEFPDTGLLGHWGLRLDPPETLGPAEASIAGRTVSTNSPGKLISTGGYCTTAASGLIARCRLGKGEAIVIADADFLDIKSVEGASGEANFGLLLEELARLEQ